MGLCGRSQEEESVIITRKASYQSMNNLYKDLEDILHTFFLNRLVIYAYTINWHYTQFNYWIKTCVGEIQTQVQTGYKFGSHFHSSEIIIKH